MGGAVAQQIARDLLKGKRFPQLLSSPFRRWIGGHIEMENAPTIMSQHQEHVKHLEANRRHGEEIDGDQLLGMILQEGAPSLRRRLAAAGHVFAHGALTDVDAKLEQFPMDAGCAPTGILPAHLADQISDLARKDRSSGLAMPHLPGPEQPKAGAMPGNDRFWLDDGQCRAPVVPDAGLAKPTTGGAPR